MSIRNAAWLMVGVLAAACVGADRPLVGVQAQPQQAPQAVQPQGQQVGTQNVTVVCPHCGKNVVVAVPVFVQNVPADVQRIRVRDEQVERERQDAYAREQLRQEQERIDLEAKRVKLREDSVKSGGTVKVNGGPTIYVPQGDVAAE